MACGWNKYPKNPRTVRRPAKKLKKKKVRVGVQTKTKGKYPASADTMIEEAVETSAKKYDEKTPEKLYRDVVVYPEIRKVALFKNVN